MSQSILVEEEEGGCLAIPARLVEGGLILDGALGGEIKKRKKKAGAVTLLRDSSGWQLRAFDPKPHRAPPPTPPHSTANRAVHQAHDLGTAALRFAPLR